MLSIIPLLFIFLHIQSCPISADSVSIVSVIHGSLRPEKKIGKLKKWTVRKFQNTRQAGSGRNMTKSSGPNMPSAWFIFLCPLYSRFPAELASILLLALSMFSLVAELSQCLCSESPYLSIKCYHIYVCCTNITLCIAFVIIRGFT
jgi:hypothetical protein